MTLPDNFSPSEHLQDVVKRIYNLAVREYFKDLGGEDWSLDISTPRASLRTALTHQDADSFLMTIARMLTYELAVNQRTNAGMMLENTSSGVYRKHKPQIVLWFQEDSTDVDIGYSPVLGRISFRLMDWNDETLTQAVVNDYANDINREFANVGGYVWRKGQTMVTYTSWEEGVQLQVLCRSEANGLELVNKVLDVAKVPFQPQFMNISKNQAESIAYPTIPPTKIILGESRKTARARPTADVRFQYALLKMKSLPNPICLVDRTGIFPDPVVRV